MVDAIAHQDPAAAREAMVRHLANSHERFMASWRAEGETPPSRPHARRESPHDDHDDACRIHAARDLRLEDVAPPELPAHDVQMKLGAGGICGPTCTTSATAASALRDPRAAGARARGLGIVERIGSAVTRVKPGDKVAVNPSHACGRCDYCLGGRFNLCRACASSAAPAYSRTQGLFRRQFVLGEAQLTRCIEDIALGELACAEPLSIGLHAVHRAGDLVGKTVLVTGGGTIGCMSVMAARRPARPR